MLKFRKATEKDIKKLAQMTAHSFSEYPLFDSVLRDSFSSLEDYIRFTTEIHEVNFRISLRKHVLLVGTENERLCSVAILESPRHGHVSLLDYILAGGLKLGLKVGFTNILQMKKLAEDVRKEINQRYPNQWYVGILAVNKEFQGQQLGSRMIEECLIPYVTEQKAELLTLITNTELNRKFYIKNGFLEVLSEQLKVGKNVVNNWGYIRNISQSKMMTI